MSFPLAEKAFKKRLAFVESKPEQSNCIGTALFLTGVLWFDYYIPTWHTSNFFSKHFEYLGKIYGPLWQTNPLQLLSLLQPGIVLGISSDPDKRGNLFPELNHVVLSHPYQPSTLIHRNGYQQPAGIVKIKEVAKSYKGLQHAFLYRRK